MSTQLPRRAYCLPRKVHLNPVILPPLLPLEFKGQRIHRRKTGRRHTACYLKRHKALLSALAREIRGRLVIRCGLVLLRETL